MTSMAKPDHIVIGHMVYDLLDEKLKREFRLLPISTEMWNYVSNYTDGKIYNLYESTNPKYSLFFVLFESEPAVVSINGIGLRF